MNLPAILEQILATPASSPGGAIGNGYKVVRDKFRPGAEITPPAEGRDRPWIAIVTSGRAEIFETSACLSEYSAYRPIRVVHPLETFGEFKVADLLTGLKELSVRKETWKIFAGPVCSVYAPEHKRGVAQLPGHLARYIASEYKHFNRKEAAHFAGCFFPHMVLVHEDVIGMHAPVEVTFVLFDSLDEIRRHDGLAKWIVESAYRGLTPYRLYQNAYNAEFYVQIAARALKSARAQKGFVEAAFDKKTWPAFAEGVTQGLEAFVHDHPIYYPAPGGWEVDLESPESWTGSDTYKPNIVFEATSIKRKLTASDFLIADRPSMQPGLTGFAPIGLFNYHLNHRIARGFNHKKERAMADPEVLYCWEREGQKQQLYRSLANELVAAYFDLNAALPAAAALRGRVSVDSSRVSIDNRRVFTLVLRPNGVPA